MVRREGGRWDVGTKNNAVYVERISENDERLFDDLLVPEEARELAGLLAKYADKLDESEDSNKSDDSEKVRRLREVRRLRQVVGLDFGPDALVLRSV